MGHGFKMSFIDAKYLFQILKDGVHYAAKFKCKQNELLIGNIFFFFAFREPLNTEVFYFNDELVATTPTAEPLNDDCIEIYIL